MPHITTIVLQSQHAPTEKEVESLIESLIACGERQGCEPLRAQAIFTETAQETPAKKRHDTLKTSRVVHDGMVQGKWESK